MAESLMVERKKKHGQRRKRGKFNVKRLVSSLFCRHAYVSNLIFCNPPNTHMETENCCKCGKNTILFHGTREGWKDFMGFDY